VRPNEAAFGGELRSSNVLRALQQMGTVEVLILDDKIENTHADSKQAIDHAAFRTLEVEQQTNESVVQKIRWTFDPRSDYPNGCGVGTDEMQSIFHHLEEFDLVWFFQLRSPDAFPNAVWPRSVVDIDNIPSMYERATLQTDCKMPDRLMALRRLFTLRRREKLLGDRFSVLAVCSDEDRDYLKEIGIRVPIHIIPNGFERPPVEPVRDPASPARLGFIGLFEYFPNRDGIQWFVNQCWPRIKREIPDVRLRLVGRDSDGPLKPPGTDIDALGWLENPSGEISTWSAMIVPVRVGAGTRVKIAHGFSQKCPIVSTSLGARGYGVQDGREMFVADTADGFSSACIEAIRNPQVAAQMAGRAWKNFTEKWTWDAIRPRIWAAAEECLRMNTRNRGRAIHRNS
jgi:polysaccharide biosynthesis protein PslH